jgi:hypothetical protein
MRWPTVRYLSSRGVLTFAFLSFIFLCSCSTFLLSCRGLFAAASEYVLQFRFAWFPQVAGHQADPRAHSTTQGKDGTIPRELQVRFCVVFCFSFSFFFFFFFFFLFSLFGSGKRQAWSAVGEIPVLTRCPCVSCLRFPALCLLSAESVLISVLVL